MKKKQYFQISLVTVLLIVSVFSGVLADSTKINSGLIDQPTAQAQFMMNKSDGLTLVEGEAPPPILAPPAFTERYLQAAEGGATTQAATILLDFVGEWSTEEKNAVSYAASLWSEVISSPVPIEIQVDWDTSGGYYGLLAYATWYLTRLNDPGAPKPDSFYSMAQANAITGKDQNAGNPEFYITFFPDYPWYTGIDGQHSSSMVDLVSVAMHEIGHGVLGSPSYYVSGNLGYWGISVSRPAGKMIPYVNDWFVVNSTGQNLIDTSLFPNPSEALYNQLNSGELYFNGPNTLEYNNNLWGLIDSESMGHLDESYSDTPNALMTASIRYGEVIHQPGPLTLGMLKDMGWEVAVNTAPRIGPLGAVMLEMNGNKPGALDLWMSGSDTFSAPSELTYSIVNTPAAEAGISLRENRYIDIAPALDWLGSTQVQIQVQDPEGLSSTGSFWVIVVEKVYTSVLPVAYKVINPTSK